MLNINHMSKVYEGKVPYRALSDINIAVEKGEFVVIMGPSESGKTTILNTIATRDDTTKGDILIEVNNPNKLTKKELTIFRRQQVGFVFQDFNLLHTLTVEENIVLPLTLDGRPVKEMKEKVA